MCSNYGNWLYSAGIGNDPREDRKFNMVKQGLDYDPQVCTYKCMYLWPGIILHGILQRNY